MDKTEIQEALGEAVERRGGEGHQNEQIFECEDCHVQAPYSSVEESEGDCVKDCGGLMLETPEWGHSDTPKPIPELLAWLEGWLLAAPHRTSRLVTAIENTLPNADGVWGRRPVIEFTLRLRRDEMKYAEAMLEAERKIARPNGE